jgi:tetratricopeptide (TPR) repeat protein
MLEKRVAIVSLISVLLFCTHLIWGQTTARAKSYMEAAEEKADIGDFPAAIELYERAVDAEPSLGEKAKIEGILNELTKLFYTDLHQQAVDATSREERIRLLIQTQSLKIRDWLFTDFEKVVLAVRGLTEETVSELKEEADTAVNELAYDQAISIYEQARELDSVTFDKDMAEQYNKIKEQLSTGKQLVQEGQSLIERGNYQEAKEKLQQANAVYPGQSAVADALRKVDSMLSLVDGKRHAEANQFEKAEELFRIALDKYQENSEAARLLEQSQEYKSHVHQGRSLYKQETCAESQSEFQLARNLNSQRFRRDQLEPLLSEGCTEMIPLPAGEIREALMALFDSRPDDSIQMLETLLEEVGENHVQVRALLGAAYCHAAFMNAEPDTEALESAKDHFRRVLNSQPDFQLSEKLFSPRILNVFEQLRSESSLN